MGWAFFGWMYNFGWSRLTQSWHQPLIKVSDAKKLTALEKVLTNFVKTQKQDFGMNQYPADLAFI